MFDIFVYRSYGSIGLFASFCITNKRRGIAIASRATARHLFIWMVTVRQSVKCQCRFYSQNTQPMNDKESITSWLW